MPTTHGAPSPKDREDGPDKAATQRARHSSKDGRDPEGHKLAPLNADPNLPHERDQAGGVTDGARSADMEQAYRDVSRGLKDTDRGPAMDKAYQAQKQAQKQAPKKG